jgi:hypothetical protein
MRPAAEGSGDNIEAGGSPRVGISPCSCGGNVDYRRTGLLSSSSPRPRRCAALAPRFAPRSVAKPSACSLRRQWAACGATPCGGCSAAFHHRDVCADRGVRRRVPSSVGAYAETLGAGRARAPSRRCTSSNCRHPATGRVLRCRRAPPRLGRTRARPLRHRRLGQRPNGRTWRIREH